MNIYAEIFTDMNFILFEMRENNRFIHSQNPPSWFKSLCKYQSLTINIDKTYNLKEMFPYIENFIDSINQISAQSKLIKSGVWAEQISQDKEIQLYVYYYTNHGKNYLILENITPSFGEQHQVLQKARDIALVNEQLLQKINTSQYLLESDIESQLINSPEETLKLINQSSSAIIVYNSSGYVEMFNQALVDIYKCDDKNKLKKTTLLEQWVSEAEEQYPEIGINLSKGTSWEGEFETTDLNGNKKWIKLTIKAVYSESSPHSHYICIANNIDNFKRSSDGILDSQRMNYITKLPSRTQFWTVFDEIINKAKANKEQFALLYIDLDFFRQINNDFGYGSGDFLLKMVSNRIVEKVNKSDFVAHLGADEFAIILKDIKSSDEIEIIAERLKENINALLPIGRKNIRITCSMGSVLFPEHGEGKKELMKHADLAMYYAKELGRNQHQFYDKQLETVTFKIERDKELREAIETQQFFLEYQPQISLQPSEISRLEALIRWQHPELGRIAPDDFIGTAERSGLIVPIGNWVLDQACAKAKDLLNKNIPTIIAVNVSSKQLKHSGFYNVIKNTLDTHNLSAKYLEIEITESCLLEGIEQIISILSKIRELGVSISLDDFGSGFSSFNYLKQLPLDMLKIDRTFIMELESSEESRVITTMIINLAKALNLKVIAEGVETKQQLDFLTKHGCDIVQGFYYYKPLLEVDITSTLLKLNTN